MTEIETSSKAMIKKKRFRPKKLLKKVFGNKNALDGTAIDDTKPEQQVIKPSSTLDTARSTYEPPASSHLAANPNSPLAKKQSSAPEAKKTSAVPKSPSIRQKLQQRKRANISKHSTPTRDGSYSIKVSDWEDFGTSVAPSIVIEEIPFDERTQQQDPPFFAKSTSNGNVEIDIYNDLDREDKEVSSYTGTPADRSIPTIVSVEQREPVVQQRKVPTPTPAEGLSKVRSFAPYETESGLRWQVLSDGTLEMGSAASVDEAHGVAPVADVVKTTTVAKRKEEKKEEDAAIMIPKVSSVKMQKARTMSPLTTASVTMAKSVRRITSLSTSSKGNRKKRPDLAETDPTEIMSDLEKQEKIHRSIRKEDPAPFVTSNSDIRAVPEVDEEQDSSDIQDDDFEVERPVTAFVTDEGTEILSTFGITQVPFEGDEEDESETGSSSGEDDDADTTFDLAEFEEANALLDSSSYEEEEEDTNKVDEDQDNPKPAAVSAAAQRDMKGVMDSRVVNEIVDDDPTVLSISAAKRSTPPRSSPPPPSQKSYLVSSLPRPAFGRSRESIEAEQQHGSIHHSQDRPAATVRRVSSPIVWSPAHSEDADDERTAVRSAMDQSVGVDTAVSFFDEEEEFEEESVVVQKRKSRKKKVQRGDNTDESDDDEEGDTLTSFGADLTEMATELRAKGPGVLMEWMDLRPLK